MASPSQRTEASAMQTLMPPGWKLYMPCWEKFVQLMAHGPPAAGMGGMPLNNEPCIQIVGYVLPRLRHGVNSAEVACLVQVKAEPAVQLMDNFVWIALELLASAPDSHG